MAVLAEVLSEVPIMMVSVVVLRDAAGHRTVLVHFKPPVEAAVELVNGAWGTLDPGMGASPGRRLVAGRWS